MSTSARSGGTNTAASAQLDALPSGPRPMLTSVAETAGASRPATSSRRAGRTTTRSSSTARRAVSARATRRCAAIATSSSRSFASSAASSSPTSTARWSDVRERSSAISRGRAQYVLRRCRRRSHRRQPVREPPAGAGSRPLAASDDHRGGAPRPGGRGGRCARRRVRPGVPLVHPCDRLHRMPAQRRPESRAPRPTTARARDRPAGHKVLQAAHGPVAPGGVGRHPDDPASGQARPRLVCPSRRAADEADVAATLTRRLHFGSHPWSVHGLRFRRFRCSGG